MKVRRHYGVTVGRTARLRTQALNETQWKRVLLLFNEAVDSEGPSIETGVLSLEVGDGCMMPEEVKTGAVKTISRLQSCHTLNSSKRLHVIQNK